MMPMSRTILAITVMVVLAVPGWWVGESLGAGDWGLAAIALAAGMLGSLVDREGFYGVDPKAKDRAIRAKPRS